MDNGIQPVMNVGGTGYGCGDGWGMNGFGGIVGLLAVLGIIGGGFGNWGNNGAGNANAIQADVNRGFDNQNLQAQTRDILAAVNTRAAENMAATNQVYHDVVGYVGDKYMELQRDIGGLAVGQANLLAKENECCCQQLRAIDGVNYNAAMNTAAIQKTIVEEAQKNRDMFTGNQMAQMQNRINQLELAQAMQGVVRYPMQTTYSSGGNPFCGCQSCGM
jgi:hypothetical protein